MMVRGNPIVLLLLVGLAALAGSSQPAAAFDIEAHKITKLMAAVYTPLKPGGLELDLDVIPRYVEYLQKRNITNVMPCGSNGESLSLSVAERKSLAEAWATAAPPKGLKVYMHIGSESLVDTRELAMHAGSLKGISGILSMTPVYFKPTVATLHDFLAQVASVAPQTPFWFYHFPDDTGVLPGQAHAFLEMADKSGAIPNLMGIKYTDYNLMDFQLCTQAGHPGKYNMLFGRDEEALAAMSLGADAAVSSTVQYAPSLREALALYAKGEMAQAKAAQMTNAQLCSMFAPYETQAKNVQKNIMKMSGMDVGPSRLPKRDLEADEFEALRAKLTAGQLIDPPSTDRSSVSELITV